MDNLKLAIQQNKYLIHLISVATFGVLLLSGVITNMILNVLIVCYYLINDTIKLLKQDTKDYGESISLLKHWLTLLMMMFLEYIFISICNVTLINVMINVLKVIAMMFLYNTFNLLYDLYIEPVFDTMTLAYIQFMKKPNRE